MRIISFYTKNTPYEKEADEWQDSFKKASTALYVMEPQGSWERNCALKSVVLQRAFEDYNDDLLYVDIDSRLNRPFDPIVEDKVGLAWYDRIDGIRELLSGTIYIPNNDNGKNLIDLWVRYQAVNPKVWDQKVLQHIVATKEIEHFELGKEWISVDGHIMVDNPIIHHTQASRRLRRKVNHTGRILQ